ncbi:MAG TPA: vitamin K epoxide reductase family protein [Solirubrobacter sp.]|nr:vitamin K epoxide reductase family protein [Solirubrobacter sp.]
MSPLRIATAALALAGVAVAGYLTWVHYADLQPVCVGGGGSCERVQSSVYATFAGIPVAVIGLAGYLALLATLALPEAPGRATAAFLALAGMFFSGYLTYAEVVEIDAICQWCVVSAVIMASLAAVSVARLLQMPDVR